MYAILIVTVISRKRMSVTVMEENKKVRLRVWERGY
jgi:hypothetical protein